MISSVAELFVQVAGLLVDMGRSAALQALAQQVLLDPPETDFPKDGYGEEHRRGRVAHQGEDDR
jgi:hypothetical protein